MAVVAVAESRAQESEEKAAERARKAAEKKRIQEEEEAGAKPVRCGFVVWCVLQLSSLLICGCRCFDGRSASSQQAASRSPPFRRGRRR